MKYTKKSIEKRYNVILDKSRAFDSGTTFWTAHSNENGEYGEYITDGYTLEDIAESIRILKQM